MKSQIENECEEIGDNFDDIEIKKLNYYRPPDSTITSNNSSISQSTLLYNNERSSQNPISNKSSDLFTSKQDIRNREEERKNIENDNYKIMKEKTISNFNSYINMNKENNGLISNKMSYKNSDKNNIKDMLYQNRNIINNMQNIINSSTNGSKTKFESSYLNNSNKSLENNNYFPNTFSTDKSNNLTKGENEKEKDIDEYKSKGKTFYNYNDNYQKKMGGEDNYLDNIETFKNDLNGKIIANSNDKNTSYQTNNNNSSTNVSNTNSNMYVEKYKFVQSDINLKDYNQQTAKFNIEGNDKPEEKKEEYKPIIKSSIPTSTTKTTTNNNINMNMNIMSNKLINTKDYFFNYRTQDAFDKMNQAMTQPVQEGKIYTSLNNNNITTNNNINKINITNFNTTSTTTKVATNYNEINIKNDSSKYNNFLNSNDLKIKKEFKQYNTIEPNNMGDKQNNIKLQIENEEKKLRKLEEEKSQLIKEEKETRQTYYNELNKRDSININNTNINMNTNTSIENSKRLNIIKAYQEKTNNQLKELLIQTKNEENKMKAITNNPNITNSATNLISNINMNTNLNTNLNTNINTNRLNMNLTQNYNSYNISSNINAISKEKSSPNLSQKYVVPNYSTNSIESEKNDNYYREFLKQIQDRNEQINKKTFDTINNNLNKNNQNFNYEKINKNEINVQKKKSLSVGHKQIEIKDYMNNYTLNYNNYDNKNYLNNNTYSNASTINIKNDYNLNAVNTTNSVNKKTRYESEKKYNINSYFQLKDKENDLKNKKTIFNYDLNYDNKNKYEQTLSSYNDENNKENNKINNTTNNTRSYPMSYTPNGLYRSNKTENNLLNNNYLPKNTIDNNNNNNRLIYNNNSNNNNNNNQDYLNNSKNIRDEIIKTLTTNNYNSMTQTRFYRNKGLPETSSLSNYSNDKLNTITNLNTIRDYNNKNNENYNGFKKQNSTRSFSNLNFDINKDLISNATKYVNNNTNMNSYMSNRQNSTIVNNTLTTLSNNTQTNNYYNINNTISSNINNNNNDIDNKLNNTNKCKCTLRKGKSCSNIEKYIDSDSLNESKLVDFYSKNYKYNYNNTNEKLIPDYNKEYGASTYNKRNTYRNATLNNFNKINNNSFKYNNNNANICDKCFQKYFSNRNFYNMENNGNSGNTGFANNNNNIRICETCKKLGAGENGIKRVNYFPFA